MTGIEVLESLEGTDSYGGFASYNLGIAFLEDGQRQLAIHLIPHARANRFHRGGVNICKTPLRGGLPYLVTPVCKE